MNFSKYKTYNIKRMDEAAELMQRCAEGDKEAFEILFVKYKLLVFKDALLMAGNNEKAEDILQDVFINIWKSADRFNPNKAKFTTWLHRITMNRCIDYYRREQPHKFDDDAIDMAELVDTNSKDLPEEVLISKVEYKNLLTAVKHLDNKHRSVLILRFFDGLSHKDISEVLEIPLGTVKSRIHNTLCMLKTQMNLMTSEISTRE